MAFIICSLYNLQIYFWYVLVFDFFQKFLFRLCVFMDRVCVCVSVCTRMCTMEYMHRSEDNVWDPSLSIHFYVGSGAQA